MNEIDIYIQEQDLQFKDKLTSIRNTVLEMEPSVSEKISFNMPTFTLNGKVLLHFAAFKKHIGIYPQPEAIIAFADDLKPYKTSKGTIQFQLTQDIPVELLKQIIKFRIDAILEITK